MVLVLDFRGKVYSLTSKYCKMSLYIYSVLWPVVYFNTFKAILFPIFAASVTCLVTSEHTLLTVSLGHSILLNCTYNCSNGFVQGFWDTGRVSTKHRRKNGSICVVSLPLKNVSAEDLGRNYTCRTENSEDESSSSRIQMVVSLQLRGRRAQAGSAVCSILWFLVNSCLFQLKAALRSRRKLPQQQSSFVSPTWIENGHFFVTLCIDLFIFLKCILYCTFHSNHDCKTRKWRWGDKLLLAAGTPMTRFNILCCIHVNKHLSG